MGEAGADKHPYEEYGGITITLSGQEYLAPGTTTGQGEGETGKHHTTEVPETVGMGYRLAFKTGIELPQDKVGDEGDYNQGNNAVKQVIITKQYRIPDGANRAEAAALRQKTDCQPD